MSFLLTDPTVVLLVGLSPGDAERVEATAIRGRATEVVSVDTLDRAREVLDDRFDVGCVVVGDGVGGGVAGEACAAIREASERVPVVAFGAVDAERTSALAALSDCRPLPRSASDDQLGRVVDDALATYERRRRHAAESSMFATLLDDVGTSIYVKDDEGRHLRMADVQYTIDPEDARGKTDVEIWGDDTPDMAEKTYRDDLEIVETGEPVYDQDEKFEQENFTYWSRSTKVPWEYDGEIRGLVGVSRDVTQQMERINELEERRQLIEQFTSYVSHDLKTPLQVASGALELARETGDEDAFAKVEQTLERMEETIDDLADLAKQKANSDLDGEDAGPEVHDDAETDDAVATPELAALVRDVWSVVGAEAAALSIDVPEGTTITAEEQAVRPLVENLLKNAITHAGPGVAITVGLTDDRGFYVEDDGPGIPPEDREKVLEEGYTTAEDGTGTGLNIVAEVAKENGWTVSVTESDAGGARIEIGDCHLVSRRFDDWYDGEAVEFEDDRSVGDPEVEGVAEYVDTVDRWIVSGGGENIWGQTNEFHFLYGTAAPPVRIEGRIAGLDSVDDYSKTGVMIRGGLHEDAPFGFAGQTARHGSEILWRMSEDGSTESFQLQEPQSAYEWYRTDYVDGVLTCYISPDGEIWTAIDQREIDLGDEVLLGLVVCSHDHRLETIAEFDDVRARRLQRR